jgi:hypothetical protein
MIRVWNTLVSALRARPAGPARERGRRELPALTRSECRSAGTRRTRLQVEALENRCLLSWGSVPPGSIPPDVAAVTVALNAQGNAAITANEIDYYILEIPASAPAVDTYVISVSTPSSNLDTVLGVYNAAGLRIAANDDFSGANRDSRVTLALNAGQRYYFGVSKLAGTPGGSYTWSVDGPGDQYENNDNRASASDLGVLTERFGTPFLSLVDGHDWYRFTMNAAGTAADRVAIQFTHAEGDLQLELTDAAGNRIGLSAGAADNEAISLDGLAAGTYFVHVYGENGAANPRYLLEIEPGAPALSPLMLDDSGFGSSAGKIRRDGAGNPVADTIEFVATVDGRMTVLMRAEQPFLQSLLTVASPATVASEAFIAGQFAGTQDHVVQFDVVAGETYRFRAGVVLPPDDLPNRPPIVVGAYRLFLSTEPEDSDFSATSPHLIALDTTGFGLQLGTLETPEDEDLFAFTATVTGRTTVRIDGGADDGQEIHFLTKPGETYAVRVFDPGDRTGVYALTITSIADDLPDDKVSSIVLDASGSGNRKGSIDYADDEDVFRFTATRTGTMTLTMRNRSAGPSEGIFTLVSEVAVSPAAVSYDLSPSRRSLADAPASDRIVQFQVVQGRQYTIRASGADGSTGDYLISLDMAVDRVSGTTAQEIALDESGAAVRAGSIATPGDRDRFQFTAQDDGFMVVAMHVAQGTNMQGMLTFPPTPTNLEVVKSPTARIVTSFAEITDDEGATLLAPVRLQAFSGVGWREATRETFVALRIEQGQTYDFLVSADQGTIGDYTLVLTTYALGPTEETTVSFETNSEGPVGVFGRRLWTFHLGSSIGFDYDHGEIAPVRETGKTPDATNTQLAAFPLPASNGGGTPGTVTVPRGQATLAGNSLINTLLVVAARDNAVRPTESVVASAGTTDVAATLFAALLTGVISPATGGTDASTPPPISGTVFEDLDGNGRLDSGEPGLAGEQVVLEVQQNGQYVVVATALTDAKGGYTFVDVPAGEYRVRRLTESGSTASPTTSAGYPVKVTGDGKPKTLDFGKPRKRGQTLAPRSHPDNGGAGVEVVHIQENEFAEQIDRAFQDWNQDDSPLDFLGAHEGDRAAMDGWLGLLALAPVAMLTIDNRKRGNSSVERSRLGASKSHEN